MVTRQREFSGGHELMERIPELVELRSSPLRLPPRRDDCAGPGVGDGRLHCQALLAGRSDGESPGGPAEERRVRRPSCWRLGHRVQRWRVTVGGPRAGSAGPPSTELLHVLSVRAGRITTHDTLLRQAWRKPGGEARWGARRREAGPPQAGRRRGAPPTSSPSRASACPSRARWPSSLA